MLNWAVLAFIIVFAPEDELRRAKNEFAYGDYPAAVERLQGVLYPENLLLSDESTKEARKTLAIAHYLQGDIPSAQTEFEKLLYLDPKFALDPYVVAPPIVELLEQVRVELGDRLPALPPEDAQAIPPKERSFVLIEQTRNKREPWVSFLPLGIGQFQNGDTGLGVTFLTLQTVFLLLNVGSYLGATYGLPPNQGRTTEARRQTYEALQITQYAAAGLFAMTWTISAIEARIKFVRLEDPSPNIRELPANSPELPVFPNGLNFELSF